MKSNLFYYSLLQNKIFFNAYLIYYQINTKTKVSCAYSLTSQEL